jgi:hypothetical protein
MRIILIALLAIVLNACAVHDPLKHRIIYTQGVVLPNGMCAPKGKVSASNDPKGERMICELEEFTGSHISKCVCRDEDEIVATREASQGYIRSITGGKCLSNGGATCQNDVPGN